jgi:hypothetical protein
MKNNKLDDIKDHLSPDQLVKVYATERLVSALEKFTDAISTAFTNPFGIGNYLKLLPGKTNPLSYLVPVNFLAVLTYYVSAKYGTELASYLTLSFAFIIDVLLVVVDYFERIDKRKKE